MALVVSKKPYVKTLLLRDDDDAGHSRNSKKSKNGLNDMEEDEWPKLGGVVNNSWQQGQSFVEKLKGINSKGEGNACEAQGNEMLVVPTTEKEQSDTEIEDGEPIWNKEKQQGDFRQKSGGSRYNILAEDGGVTVGVEANPVVQAVQFRAEPKPDLQSMTAGSSIKVKKGGAKKRINKKQSATIQRGEQEHNRQEQRKEKRLREGFQKEKECVENGESTYETSKSKENQNANLMEEKNEGDVSAPLQNVANREAEELIQGCDSGVPLFLPPEPGDSERLGELQGKFWIGPNDLGQNVDMEDDIEEDSPQLGSLVSVVPNSQYLL
ncbi:hypothetical protein K1719_044542 [Acacia pycnantha]|nr:hypothetical protein K1719_044542 [Acacia pycnantha]